MPNNSHRIGDPARNLAHLIGEAISDDVDAWDWMESSTLDDSPRIAELMVTRDGRTYSVRVAVTED